MLIGRVPFRGTAAEMMYQHSVEEVTAPAVSCLCHQALLEWHFGEIVSCHATMAEGISLAKDMHALVVALWLAACLGNFERNPAEVERFASDLIELATRQSISKFLGGGKVLRGWAQRAALPVTLLKVSRGSRRE
jgi:hypothetical protein